ncbi:MAG: hypothetical protein MK030_02220, partial [SAR116 cluster bacterium]|nr:hypothetical protein [SAR116 cluster bacterium]
MRAKTDGLNHRANGAFGNQLCGAGDSGNLETFGKIGFPKSRIPKEWTSGSPEIWVSGDREVLNSENPEAGFPNLWKSG